jgi:S1-C subfamily serine protease
MSLKNYSLMMIALIALLALNQDVQAQAVTPPPSVIYCYDRERDVVSRELAGACRGTIVDEAEAEAIKERREREVARAIGKSAIPSPAGRRLASLGTAFYVNEIGRLVTNQHVVADCGSVMIRLMGDKVSDAQILAVDAQHDLALLQGSDRSPAYATFRSGDGIGLSGSVLMVGFPDRGMPVIVPVATAGTLLRANDGLGRIVISADVHHGNSGSPIFDTGGLVIGVVDAKLNLARIFAETGAQTSETGVGIAATVVVDFLRRTNTHFYTRDRNADTDSRGIFEGARAFVVRTECWK